MNAQTILNNTLSLVTPRMHKIRYQALRACPLSEYELQFLYTSSNAFITPSAEILSVPSASSLAEQ